MAKFGRTYILKIESPDAQNEIVEITMPFSLDFQVSRSMTGGANTASFTIYNLGQIARSTIYKDPFILEARAVQLFAGYDDGEKTVLPMIFNGQLKSAFSSRDGTEWKTEIEAFDGAYAMTTGNMNASFTAGQSMKDTLLNVMGQLPGIAGSTVGGGFDQKTQRGQVLMGNPAEFLKMASNNRFFIDKNHAYILNDDEVLKGDIAEIDASTGLLGTPKKAGQLVECEVLFEPRITLAQSLKLTSSTNKVLNGEYRVVEIVHAGNISPVIGGAVTTKLKLIKGNGLFKEVPR